MQNFSVVGFWMSASTSLVHSIQASRSTQGRALMNKVVIRAYNERIRGAYYKDMYDRKRVSVDLTRLRL